jgi:hypothetical protein
MRHFVKRIALLSAALMIMALPVFADDSTEGRATLGPDQQNGKEECLLVAANSCDRVGTFQGKIDAIMREINKGSAVYTNDELRILNRRLQDTIGEMNETFVEGGA